jgi:methionyl-tRNA formyltransferase
MLSLVFFGNEKLATGSTSTPIIKQSLQDAGFTIEQIVTGSLSELAEHTSQIAVLAAYGHIIPRRILDEFPLGIINIHPSLLPQYRGPTPIETAILEGAAKTGVSIMKLTTAMDEGPIYRQQTIALTGNEQKHELAEHLQTIGAQLLVDTLPRIASGELKPRQQPHPDRATYSKKLQKSDGVLNYTKTAQQLERQIRAFADWPKSTTKLGDIETVITQASITNDIGPPGAVYIRGKQLLICCTEGALSVEKLKPAGKTEMTAESFLAGYGGRIPANPSWQQ